MSTVWTFLTRTQGRNGSLTITDYASYAYLLLGFLIIFLPVSWVALNSIKSQFQLEKQDLAILPTDYERVGRATVNGLDGREIFILQDLPDWLLNWAELRPEEKDQRNPSEFVAQFEGNAFYALRSHLSI